VGETPRERGRLARIRPGTTQPVSSTPLQRLTRHDFASAKPTPFLPAGWPGAISQGNSAVRYGSACGRDARAPGGAPLSIALAPRGKNCRSFLKTNHEWIQDTRRPMVLLCRCGRVTDLSPLGRASQASGRGREVACNDKVVGETHPGAPCKRVAVDGRLLVAIRSRARPPPGARASRPHTTWHNPAHLLHPTPTANTPRLCFSQAHAVTPADRPGDTSQGNSAVRYGSACGRDARAPGGAPLSIALAPRGKNCRSFLKTNHEWIQDTRRPMVLLCRCGRVTDLSPLGRASQASGRGREVACNDKVVGETHPGAPCKRVAVDGRLLVAIRSRACPTRERLASEWPWMGGCL